MIPAQLIQPQVFERQAMGAVVVAGQTRQDVCHGGGHRGGQPGRGDNPQAADYYLVEWGGILLGFTACIVGFRRHPDLPWFELMVVLLSFTSGPAQGMHRYILAAPPVFLFLTREGRNKAFDKSWTILSILLMGMYAMLFTFDMWTG